MTSLSSAPSNGILEGHATNQPSLFDDTNYQLWSTRIAIYIQTCDMDMWDIIMKGHFVPSKKNKANEIVPKSKFKWTTDDKVKEILENELVKKLLQSLSKSWKPKVIAIKEMKNLNFISLDEVYCSLLSHEQEMKEDEEEEKKESAAKRKSIALKVSSIENDLIHISDISEDDDELALAARRFNRLLLKRNPRYDMRFGRRDFNQSWKKKGKKDFGNSKQK
ncbi:hypothetical protein REPUB_Repub10bG0092300 [Reevesia pubescens]